MTFEENGNEEVGTPPTRPKLATISTKGLFASMRDRGDDVTSTPDSDVLQRGRGVIGSGVFSSRRSESPGRRELNPMRPNMSRFLTPARTFSRLRDEKDELSRLTPSPPPPHSFTDSFKFPLVGEVKPKALIAFARQWLRSPKNIALLIWGIAVAISGAILFMVMTGMLNSAIPSKNTRNTWFEVSNQIINALFTLFVLYVHPTRCLHLYYLYRWNQEDILKLRSVYCKNGTRKPNEWFHILVVVLLLQLNCIAQYALCGLNWGYRRAQRPAIGVAITLVLSFGGAAAAGIYNNVSPLGKEFEEKEDVEDPEKVMLAEPQSHDFVPRTRIYRMLERRVSFACRDEGVIVETPQWKGGLFDVSDEPTVSMLSTFCCVCVFGWNMERLGFGNRYVHMVTFVLICTAPFWIFDLAAINLHDRTVRYAIGGTGIALCAFGLLYGGYWRIRMRDRFNLPGNRCCCGKPAFTDCFQWLFCPLCSLCQEVRTAEYYDIKDDRFYTRNAISPSSPPPGFASPHTPAATLAAVKEMPDSMSEMNLVDVELRGHDSPYRAGAVHPRSPLAPPTPVTATRNTNGVHTGDPVRGSSPLLSSPTSPGKVPPSDGTARPSTSNNPFLQPEVYSSTGGSPLRSSPNPSNQVELTSQASEALMRSPTRPPNHGSA